MSCPVCKDASMISSNHKCSDYLPPNSNLVRIPLDYISKELSIPKASEPHVLIPLTLLIDLYAEIYKTHPGLSSKLKKCITGEK